MGPEMSLSGRIPGGLYYYFLRSLMTISASPLFIYHVHTFLGLLSLSAIYIYLAKYFGTVSALLSGLFFATTPALVILLTELWNPSFIPLPATIIALLTCQIFSRRGKNSIIWIFVVAALGLQFHFNLLLLGAVTLSIVGATKYRGSYRQWVIGGFLFILIFVPYLIDEFSNDFSNSLAIFQNPTPGDSEIKLVSVFSAINRFNDAVFSFRFFYLFESNNIFSLNFFSEIINIGLLYSFEIGVFVISMLNLLIMLIDRSGKKDHHLKPAITRDGLLIVPAVASLAWVILFHHRLETLVIFGILGAGLVWAERTSSSRSVTINILGPAILSPALLLAVLIYIAPLLLLQRDNTYYIIAITPMVAILLGIVTSSLTHVILKAKIGKLAQMAAMSSVFGAWGIILVGNIDTINDNATSLSERIKEIGYKAFNRKLGLVDEAFSLGPNEIKNRVASLVRGQRSGKFEIPHKLSEYGPTGGIDYLLLQTKHEYDVPGHSTRLNGINT